MSTEAKTAIHDNDAERLDSLLRDNPGEDAIRELWWEAVTYGSTPCLTVLLEKGAPFDSRDTQSWSAMHRLSEDGNLEALRLLISYGANMGSTNMNNRTPLHIAVRNGREECVRVLLEEGADMWFEDCNGTTPIVYATRYLGILKMLLEHMKNFSEDQVSEEYRRRQINRSILNATLLERTDILSALIEAGADCNAYDGRPLNTALMRGNADVVRILLEGGARPSLCRLTILRPMFVAVFRGHVECVKLLLQHGGEVNETHSNGDTPLLTAATEGQTAMVKYLVEHNADVNHQGGHGQTALHHAVYLGKADMTQILLVAGASPNICGEDNSLPIHNILSHSAQLTPSHLECMGLLLQYESEVALACTDSRYPEVAFTPLVLAWWHQHLRPLHVFLAIGCTLSQNRETLVSARRRAQPSVCTVSEETLNEQLDKMTAVPELQALCRGSIRTIFSGRLNDLYNLALPTPIKEYLDYCDLDWQ